MGTTFSFSVIAHHIVQNTQKMKEDIEKRNKEKKKIEEHEPNLAKNNNDPLLNKYMVKAEKKK